MKRDKFIHRLGKLLEGSLSRSEEKLFLEEASASTELWQEYLEHRKVQDLLDKYNSIKIPFVGNTAIMHQVLEIALRAEEQTSTVAGISEVRVRLNGSPKEALRAFCSVILNNGIVIRNVKVIRGRAGYFVSLPSMKVLDRCPSCGGRNYVRSRYCSDCGGKLQEDRAQVDSRGRPRLHEGIVESLTVGPHDAFHAAILDAFEAELVRSKEPDYQPSKKENVQNDEFDSFEAEWARSQEADYQPPKKKNDQNDKQT